MIMVIETNLSLDNENKIVDHQSRVVDVKDWDSFVNEIKETKTVVRNPYLGIMYGATIPENATVENLNYDDRHLMCDIYNSIGMHSIKLAYII